MATSLIRGKHLICGVKSDDQIEIIDDGAVLQRDGKIVEVGTFEELQQRVAPEQVLGDGSHVVVPGFVNGHHHIGVTPTQLGCTDEPLELWVPQRATTRKVDSYLDTLYSAFEMIESGITTVQHINLFLVGPLEPNQKHVEAVLRAYRDVGMRVSLCFMFHDQCHLGLYDDQAFVATFPPDLRPRMAEFVAYLDVALKDQVDFWESLHRKHNTEPRTRIQLAPANLHWSSDELLEAMADLSERYSAPMHMHLLETAYQKEYARRRTGTTSVNYLNRFKLLSQKMTLGHGVWVNDEDIEMLAGTGTLVCHCPSSNLRLCSGTMPLNRLAELGVGVGLGIDEAGINDDRDMLLEMRLALNLHREPGHDSARPTHEQVLRMATEGGAKTTPFGSEIGTLKPGQAADMTMVRWDQIAGPYMDAKTPVIRAFVHRAKTSGVDNVIVDGELIYKDGRFTKVDKEAVLRELSESLKKPLTDAEKQLGELGSAMDPHVRSFYKGYLDSEVRDPYYRRNTKV